MISYAHIVFFVGLCFYTANGQVQSVYLSADDFFAGKVHTLSNASKIKTVGINIDKSRLNLVRPDTLIEGKDVFVFADAHKNNYRFINGMWLQCLQISPELQLYKVESQALQGKVKTQDYFFGKDLSSQVYPLSLGNLLMVFADDLAFCLLLELYFTSEKNLLEYDQLHNTYKVCRLRQLSKKVMIKN